MVLPGGWLWLASLAACAMMVSAELNSTILRRTGKEDQHMTWEPPFQEPTGPQGPFTEYGARYSAYGPATRPQMPPPGEGPQARLGAPGPGVNAPPLSLWEAIKQLPRQYWRVLTNPGTATFADEMR